MSVCYDNIKETPIKKNVGECECGGAIHEHRGSEMEEYQVWYFHVNICSECGKQSKRW